MRASSVNQIILKILAQDQSHLTAQQIYERIQEQLPAVNQSTVYRSLERLANAGQVSVSDMGVGAAVYETVGGKLHHHLVCQECGAIIDLDESVLLSIKNTLLHDYKFVADLRHLAIFGRCIKCKK